MFCLVRAVACCRKDALFLLLVVFAHFFSSSSVDSEFMLAATLEKSAKFLCNLIHFVRGIENGSLSSPSC